MSKNHFANVLERSSSGIRKINFTHFAASTMIVLLALSCKNHTNQKSKIPKLNGMVWVSGGTFYQGAHHNDTLAMWHEKPRHQVQINGFYIDIHEVTNQQFSEFVKATGYVTVAEREIDWQDIKKQLPSNTVKPHDSVLKPGSLVFKKTVKPVTDFMDYSQWWFWKTGANWKHPQGKRSNIIGKENHPVVHIAYEDAEAYCKWKGRRLPTEAEWEYAAKTTKADGIYTWGNSHDLLVKNANTWTGQFPTKNNVKDGFERTAPVGTYPPNPNGLFDMAGNVWEWTSDWYNPNYYATLQKKGLTKNPMGAETPFNPNNPYVQEKIIKGGSFLCNALYCANYRISARMSTTIDSSMEHLGFRTVKELSK